MAAATAHDPERWSRIASETLRRAADEVVRRMMEHDPSGSHGSREVEAVVVDVARAVERIRGDGDVAVVRERLQDPLLGARAVRAVRAVLLERWSRDDSWSSPDETLELLAALEQVRQVLWRARPGEEAEGFAARLSEPDAYELIVGLAHDLRSPLSSIQFLAETLRSEHSGRLNDLQKSQLGLIYSASFGILSVVQDVMELAKARQNPEDVTPTPFSVDEVLESVHEMVRPMAEEKGVRLEFDVPDCRPRVGNPQLLSRVMLNLTTNALKFTDEGSVTVSVERAGRGQLRFAVEDTGRGISPENEKTLFQPFQRSERDDGHFFSSTGLGLSTVRRHLSAMGADLEYDTEPGEGTCFHFVVELPRAPEL